ncbi:MAG: hypothetical protein J6M64_04120 [Oscillospiraceae bacterium]|nr:hypothetical protein [Oscillospiraceae bacterium]
MSTREKCIQILDTMPEFQLEFVFPYIQGMTALEEEIVDAFCEFLYQKYLNNPDRNEFVSEKDLCNELDITI